jgi:hypothetical protein
VDDDVGYLGYICESRITSLPYLPPLKSPLVSTIPFLNPLIFVNERSILLIKDD